MIKMMPEVGDRCEHRVVMGQPVRKLALGAICGIARLGPFYAVRIHPIDNTRSNGVALIHPEMTKSEAVLPEGWWIDEMRINGDLWPVASLYVSGYFFALPSFEKQLKHLKQRLIQDGLMREEP